MRTHPAMLAENRVRIAWMVALTCLLSGGCTVRSTADKQPEADHDGRPDESSDRVESDGSTGNGGAASTATGTGSASSGCGDAVCDIGETCGNCPADCDECAPGCNDGICGEDESCWTCPEDCGDCCGDGACAGGSEDCSTCPADCGVCEGGDPPGTGCGNGVCETAAGETPCSCPTDCPNDPNSCEACECGTSGGSCYCDAACTQYGDCCANACQACGQCGTSTTSSSSSGGGTGPYYWMTTCGDPVCGGYVWKADVPSCSGVVPGQSCSQPGVSCDPVNPCNSLLVCTDTDPKQYGCPKSLARFKRDITYLDEAEVNRLHAELIDMRLASWQYNEEPATAREHVGFIIDDAPTSAAVAADGEHVDLYGYATMAAAALQVQQRRIETMEKELATLRAEMRALGEQRRSR